MGTGALSELPKQAAIHTSMQTEVYREKRRPREGSLIVIDILYAVTTEHLLD